MGVMLAHTYCFFTGVLSATVTVQAFSGHSVLFKFMLVETARANGLYRARTMPTSNAKNRLATVREFTEIVFIKLAYTNVASTWPYSAASA